MKASIEEEIKYAINTYGHLLNLFDEVSGEQFSQMIHNVYDCTNERNKYICNLVKENILKISRQPVLYFYTLKNNQL